MALSELGNQSASRPDKTSPAIQSTKFTSYTEPALSTETTPVGGPSSATALAITPATGREGRTRS